MKRITKNNEITTEKSLIEKYLTNIKNYEVLSTEEELDLIKKIKQGDISARDKLIEANLKFVVSVAKQYQNRGLPLPDLISEGNLGLIDSIQYFDETRGFKFISYAVKWIQKSILEALNKHSNTIYDPNRNLRKKINKAIEKFMQTNERHPTIEELMETLNLPQRNIKSFFNRTLSMDKVLKKDHHESPKTMHDILPSKNNLPDKIVEKKELPEKIIPLLEENLFPREIEIIKLYFGIDNSFPMSSIDIGEKLNLSYQSVNRIKSDALKKLRQIIDDSEILF